MHNQTADFYNADAAVYDQLRWRSRAGQHNREAQLEIVASLLTGDLGRAVEVGSGTGRFSPIIAARAQDFILVDVAREMLVVASSAAQPSQPVLGDAIHLPLQGGSATTLVCLNVLNHIPEYEAALRDFGRVLAPGGRLLVNFNNLDSPYLPAGLVVNYRKRSFRASVFSHWQRWQAFMSALTDAGFELDTAVGHMPLPGRSPDGFVPVLAGIDRGLRSRPSFSPAPLLLVVRGNGETMVPSQK